MLDASDVEVRRYVWQVITAAHMQLGEPNICENRVALLQAILKVNLWWGGRSVPHVSVGIGSVLTLTIDVTKPVALPGKGRGPVPAIDRIDSKLKFVKMVTKKKAVVRPHETPRGL